MKFISSKQIQKGEPFKSHGKVGKYLITLEISDTDIEKLEDFAMTYSPFQLWNNFLNKKITMDEFNNESEKCDFNDKYQKWIMKFTRCFFKSWEKYE